MPPTPHPGLQEVLRSPAIWRGRALAQEQQRQTDKSIAPGFATRAAGLPEYTAISTTGPAHAPLFVVRVRALGREAEGMGESKRVAETAAAENWLAGT